MSLLHIVIPVIRYLTFKAGKDEERKTNEARIQCTKRTIGQPSESVTGEYGRLWRVWPSIDTMQELNAYRGQGSGRDTRNGQMHKIKALRQIGGHVALPNPTP